MSSSLPELAELAFTYHDYGFNALPLANPAKTATKHPAIQWRYGEKDYTQEHFTHEDISRNAGKYHHGIIAITGIDHNHNIDFDKVKDFSLVDEFLDLLGLPHDYEWVVLSGSGSGAQIWIHNAEPGEEDVKDLSDYDARDKARFDHVELRWRGNCCVLPPSVHPSGNLYKFRTGAFPDGGPATVSLERIKHALDTIGTVRHAAKEPSVTTVKSSKESKPAAYGDTPYGLSALRDECLGLATTQEGSRNTRLNLAAFRLGQLVTGGELTCSTVEYELLAAADRCGLDSREIEATLKSGLAAGMLEPRSRSQLHLATDNFTQEDEDEADLESLTLEQAKQLIIELRREKQRLQHEVAWWDDIMSNPNVKAVQRLMVKQFRTIEQTATPKIIDGKPYYRIDTEDFGKAIGADKGTVSRNLPALEAGGVIELETIPWTAPNGYKNHLLFYHLTGAEMTPAAIELPNKGRTGKQCIKCGNEMEIKHRWVQRQEIALCKHCQEKHVYKVQERFALPVGTVSYNPQLQDATDDLEEETDEIPVASCNLDQEQEEEKTDDATQPMVSNVASLSLQQDYQTLEKPQLQDATGQDILCQIADCTSPYDGYAAGKWLCGVHYDAFQRYRKLSP